MYMHVVLSLKNVRAGGSPVMLKITSSSAKQKEQTKTRTHRWRKTRNNNKEKTEQEKKDCYFFSPKLHNINLVTAGYRLELGLSCIP